MFNPWRVDLRDGLLGDNTGNEFGQGQLCLKSANSAGAMWVAPVGPNFKAFGIFIFFHVS